MPAPRTSARVIAAEDNPERAPPRRTRPECSTLASVTQPSAFYLPDGPGRFVATELTRGPWSADHQHGGPPSALLTAAMEKDGDDAAAWRLARITVDMLRPVPIGPVAVKVEAVRRGGRAQWLSASLVDDDGSELMRATGLRLRRSEVALPPAKDPPPPPLPDPATLEPLVFSFFRAEIAYHRGVEVRVARGRWPKEPTAAWMRLLHPLVAEEESSPLSRLVALADAANGVALVLDPSRFAFINPDLAITTWRDPQGEWFGLDTHATAHGGGGGLVHAVLHDVEGALGHSIQSLLVQMR
jgi:hypothetical protein